MRIETAEERKEIDIPISEIIQEGGRLNIFPSVRNYFSVDYKPGSQKLSLVAGGYIGLIPINNNLAIEIKSKFSISNLTRIVAVAEDNFNTLSFFSRKYKESADQNPVVFEFMAECLLNELQTLQSEGILKTYLLKKEETSKIRGRVNINDSIKSLWSHGHFNKAAINYYDFTSDNAFNRLIKYTIKYCIEELAFIKSKKISLRELLIEYYSSFDSVSPTYSEASLNEVFDAIESDKVSTLRNYYVNICEICRLILNKRGVDFSESGEDQLLSSFTLDMAVIFEKYLLNSVRSHRSLLPENTLVLDGNKEGKKCLYNQPSIAKGEAKPDIILKEGDQYKLIVDAKYKVKTKDTDRYQVVTHALSYNAKTAVLILPKDDGYSGNSLLELGTVGSEYGITVYEYYFDLASDDLVNEEIALVNCLNQIIQNIN
ncbi:MAG: hypothetical protein Q8J66_09345 [Methylotenera sp.]|nr:hypothetical protein [Methylotenera sp.]